MVTIPTLSQLYNDILSDLQSQYNVNIPIFGKVFLRAVAAVQAGKLKLFYLGLGNIQKNIWPDTADSVSIGGTLERFGLIKIKRNPFQAVAAQYTVQVTGLAGAVIPGYGKTQFLSDASSLNPGYLFTLDAPYTCTGSNDFITVRALTPGNISKLNIGDKLTATAPITNVTETGNTVTAVVVQPLDAETIEEYRTVVLYAFQSTPQGGAASDYRIWAGEVQGVAKVYPYAVSGRSNEINLFIESDVVDSTDGHGTPDVTIILEVLNQIEGNPYLGIIGKRPLGVFLVNYLPVTPYAVNVNISAANPVFTSTQKTAITNALTSWINTVRPFIAGAEILANKNDVIDLNNLILQILTAVPGSSFGAVTFTVNGTAFSVYQFVNGFIPYLNSVTYI